MKYGLTDWFKITFLGYEAKKSELEMKMVLM